ncbi:helix-turn-helix transcriptional regulator [Dactylosporangium sp. NPDC051485]|uniref:helix-turn-helix domain-containing protein n=1 Tax=Dactylosporangium sp. NPDC051485 TaxID=3154846 RepID=UPI0034339313
MPSPSSSVQQAKQALGSRLREIRNDAGLTGRRLADLAGWHRTKVSKIEHGTTTPTPDDIRVWCVHCTATDQSADLIASLKAVEGMFVEWRRLERTGLRLAQESVTPLFDRTRIFRAYESWLVPGLLQTAGYTAAILTATAARRNVPDDIDEAVAVRMHRQRVLTEGDHRFAVVIEESVLRAGIAEVDVMAGQLGHLLTVGSLPSVSLGIIPFGHSRALRPVEGFWIFDEERVTVELISGFLTITQPREIAMYVHAFDSLAGQAVFGAAARTLIASAITALDDLS